MSQQSNSSLFTSNTQFSLDLFNSFLKSVGSNNNFVYSPLSIYLALLMTMSGADGNTLEVMKKALHVKSDQDLKKWRESTLRQYVNNLLSMVNNNKEIISIGNRIFLENTAKVEQDYQKFVEDVFGVSVCSFNFQQDPQTERKKINDWVEERTNKLIKDLLPIESIDNNTRIVLVNVIYFLGKWKTPFDTQLTKLNQVFRQVDGKTSNVATMMNMRGNSLPYGENSHVKYVQLLYEKPEFSMYFIMSKDDQVVTSNAEKETENWLYEQLQSGSITKVLPTSSKKINHLSIPKFDIEYMLSLKDTLSEEPFGMEEAFSNSCNLRNMMQSHNIKISDVIHKAVIKVSEQGTEAAAATAVICKDKKKSVTNKPIVINFVADRPFIFLLAFENSILFMGKVNKI